MNDEVEPDWPDRDDEFENSENSEDSSDLSISVKDFGELLVAPADWTIGTLYSQIGVQIDLDPAFQRRNVWNTKAKSRFIESLFLGIPIPQILLSSKKGQKSSFIVLDGKQRLLTIKEFIDGKFSNNNRIFKLKDLRVLKELEGKTWEQIKKDTAISGDLLNETQRTTVLRGWENENVLYEIFFRLNSGSVKLSPMELRTSLYPGDFLRFIVGWTEKIGPLHKLLRKTQPDPRMADVELSVRYLAISDNDIVYIGDLKKFLDEICQRYNGQWTDEFGEAISAKLDKMNSAIDAGMRVFGEKGFCRKYVADDFENRFNRAIFDVMVTSLSDDGFRAWALANPRETKDAFIALSADNEFVRSVETTTKSVEATKTRFSKWFEEVKKISGLELAMPAIKK